MGAFDGWRRFIYRVKAGNLRARNANETPLIVNIRKAYEKTPVGTFSKAVSEWSHLSYIRFIDYLVYQWRLYWVRRTVVVVGSFFAWIWWGYMFSGWGKNLVTMGYFQGFVQPYDISLNLMNAYGGDEKIKYTMQLLTLF